MKIKIRECLKMLGDVKWSQLIVLSLLCTVGCWIIPLFAIFEAIIEVKNPFKVLRDSVNHLIKYEWPEVFENCFIEDCFDY